MSVNVARDRLAWMRRAAFASVLILTAVAPGPASGWTAQCRRQHCEIAGQVRWARPLPGSWIVRDAVTGATPAYGQAYVALGGAVAVVGAGLTVSAFQAATGARLWTSAITGFPPGSAIISVRAWPGVVTVGVELPAPDPASKARTRASPGAGGQASYGGARMEVVLRSATGQRMRAFPAAAFGGAVTAGPGSTVIVGPHAVTKYSNRTGVALWSRPTGLAPQPWQLDGGRLYVTVAAGGYLGGAPVTALRRIDLATGGERLVRPRGGAFAGELGLAFDNVVLFSGASGVTAYSGINGAVLWRRASALPDTYDAVTGRLCLMVGDALVEVDPRTGDTVGRVKGAEAAPASGLYGVRERTALGIDHGTLGKTWGYDIAAQRVVWTSPPLPWPHYFVDLSGVGGSAPPGADTVLLAICQQLGAPLPDGPGKRCAKPRLAAINR